MNQIAIISDVHGNMPALDAVIADISRRGIGHVLNLGDLVGKGPSPAEAVDRCRELCEVTVKGNWDDGTATGANGAFGDWTRHRLGPARLKYLETLPDTFEFTMGRKRVRLFHASQAGIYQRVHMNDAPEKHLAMFNNTPFTGETSAPDIVGYGDIHQAYVMSFRNRMLFNAGSVGNPLDMPLAAYTILEGGEPESTGLLSIQIVRVPYDIEQAIADAMDVDMPDVEMWANELRTSRYRGRTKVVTAIGRQSRLIRIKALRNR